MKMIDFSCKHDVLIRNEDGTLLSMDEPYFEAKVVAPGVWQILSDGDYSYLVEGDEEALVIDSGYGCGNIREFCETLTDKPVRKIANTHDHFDHTANNCYFECAYMSEETRKKATMPFPSFEGIIFPRDYPVEIIGEGYKFQLGNREIEVFEIPDHADGSLAFLDAKGRVLFIGDEIAPHSKNLKGSVARFEMYLLKLSVRRKDYDILCAGCGVFDASFIDRYLANVQYILAGHRGDVCTPIKRSYEVERDPSGRIIYQRRLPRPCDLPKNLDESTGHNRIVNYAGCSIIYDIRRIYC